MVCIGGFGVLSPCLLRVNEKPPRFTTQPAIRLQTTKWEADLLRTSSGPRSLEIDISHEDQGPILPFDVGSYGRGSKPMVPLWARCTTHVSLFQWGLGCSLGVRGFDP